MPTHFIILCLISICYGTESKNGMHTRAKHDNGEFWTHKRCTKPVLHFCYLSQPSGGRREGTPEKDQQLHEQLQQRVSECAQKREEHLIPQSPIFEKKKKKNTCDVFSIFGIFFSSLLLYVDAL